MISATWVNKHNRDVKEYCSGGAVHSICTVDVGDLRKLQFKYDPDSNYQVFFHNKFFLERDRVVMDCAEQELLRRNREEYYRDVNTN